MLRSPLNRRITRWLQHRFGSGEAQVAPRAGRGPVIHVVIIDGTMSSLHPDCIGNAGLAYRLLQEMGGGVSLYYVPGLQWSHWRRAGDVIAGRGINRQIRQAYSWLASRYRPGDKIYFLGYSRGGYAIRSLAGIIDRVGLLRADAATERNVRDIYRFYRNAPDSTAAKAFAGVHCHENIEIEMVGVWDTVKSLGINLPWLWRLSVPKHAFHNHALGPSVKRGYQALARNETRVAYSPIMWETRNDWDGHLVQMWFRGTHGDIGGQLGGFELARPLANIPLVWMLEQAERCGLPLPDDWVKRFPTDPTAPTLGPFRGAGRWLISRKQRPVGLDPSERVHISVAEGRNVEPSRLPLPAFLKRS